MTEQVSADHLPNPLVKIPPVAMEHNTLALGCWTFGGSHWGGQKDADSIEAMKAAQNCGMNHFDTASGYGDGHSEQLVGQFVRSCGERIFVASKASVDEMSAKAIRQAVDKSLQNLQMDAVDLYYIHWPRAGKDMRPLMEGLETCRAKGKIRAIGVSNFSVEQMQQVGEVGHIDAHQFCYNLLWRFPEKEIIPYCQENQIAVVSYSSIAQGILTGKFPRHPEFAEGDLRAKTVLFDPEVWPHVYEGVEQMKKIAESADRPLAHLAIRWVTHRPHVTSVLVGARNADQVEDNAGAMTGTIKGSVLSELTRISDDLIKHIPETGNIFRYYP